MVEVVATRAGDPEGPPTEDDKHRRLQALKRSAQERVDTARATSSGVRTALVVQDRDRAVGGNLLACAIAYRVFIWFLPFALLIAVALGQLRATGADEPRQVGEELGLGDSVISVVADAAAQAERSRFVMLVIALFGVYTAGAAGAKTVVAVHRFAWRMPMRRARTGPVAAAAFTGTMMGALLLVAWAQWVRTHLPGVGLGATLVVALTIAAGWLGVSMLLPHGDAPWPHLIPGCVLLGAGTQFLHLVTVYYLARKIDTASELYGGLGVAATLLLGLYLMARLIVASAVLNATLWERSRARAAQADL